MRDWTALLNPNESDALGVLGVDWNAVLEPMIIEYRKEAMQKRIQSVHQMLTQLTALSLEQQEALVVAVAPSVAQLTTITAKSQ